MNINIQLETEDKLIGKCQLLTRSEIYKKTLIQELYLTIAMLLKVMCRYTGKPIYHLVWLLYF